MLGAAHPLVVGVAQGLLVLVPFLPLLAATAGQELLVALTVYRQFPFMPAAVVVLAVRQVVLAVLVVAVLAPASLRDRR